MVAAPVIPDPPEMFILASIGEAVTRFALAPTFPAGVAPLYPLRKTSVMFDMFIPLAVHLVTVGNLIFVVMVVVFTICAQKAAELIEFI